ncbi:hypothetical protein DXG01_005909 [Tephrocybe rancida]|nr:hypothetical protein DXG01_005909 [Tephrocybe rancida]
MLTDYLHLPLDNNEGIMKLVRLANIFLENLSPLSTPGRKSRNLDLKEFCNLRLAGPTVNLPDAQKLAYQSALEGIVLLKNDGTLPFKHTIRKLVIVGLYANATTQMQGNYQGGAPFVVSPLQGAFNTGYEATFEPGTGISDGSTSGFAAAVAAAQAADVVIFAGGIDGSVENEAMDRTTIAWPGSYPGQSGGTAIFDILSGKASPQVAMTDMKLRPSGSNLGRTYKWYQTPVFEFGHGLHFTSFSVSWQRTPARQYNIQPLISHASSGLLGLASFDTFDIVVRNTGKVASFCEQNGGPCASSKQAARLDRRLMLQQRTVGGIASNAICDHTKDPATRAKAAFALFTVDELIANTGNLSPGCLASASQVISGGLKLCTATSFPQAITLASAYDDPSIKAVATVISTEARAFNNFGRAGLDYFTPNINPFRDPRWGRGQETPGEDPYHISQYVLNHIDGLQGGIDSQPYFKIIADCKHYAAYDIENWEGHDRTSFDAQVTLQDLSEYCHPPFQSCVRDTKVASVMCSYNSVNGIPSCANSYLLQTILRDHWGFKDDRWLTSDCDAVDNIFSTHHFTDTYPEAVADALKAGTDIDCGTAYPLHLPDVFNQSLINRADLEKTLVRQYTSLVRLGYFDPPSVQPYRQLSWSDVNLPDAQNLAALEGIVSRNVQFLTVDPWPLQIKQQLTKIE